MGRQYITSIERLAIERGRHETLMETLEMLLQQRFGTLPDWARQKVSTASTEELQRWVARVMPAGSLETVFDDS